MGLDRQQMKNALVYVSLEEVHHDTIHLNINTSVRPDLHHQRISDMLSFSMNANKLQDYETFI